MGFGGEFVVYGMWFIARMVAEEFGKFRIDVLEVVFVYLKKDEIIVVYNCVEYFIEWVVFMQWWSDYVLF